MTLARNALDYAEGKGTVIYGTPDVESGLREIQHVIELRRDLPNAVLHFALTLHPDDRSLTDENLATIALDGMEHLGYENCPIIIVRHTDQPHQHVHIVTTRIGFDSQRVERRQEIERAAKWAREQEIKHDLHRIVPLDPKHPLRRGNSITMPPAGSLNQDIPVEGIGQIAAGALAIKIGLKNHHTIRDLVKYIESVGYGVQPKLEPTGKLKTLLIQSPGTHTWLPLSKFKELSIAQMQKKHGLQTVSPEDLAALGQRLIPMKVSAPKITSLVPPMVSLVPSMVSLVPPMQKLTPPIVSLVPEFKKTIKEVPLVSTSTSWEKRLPAIVWDWFRGLVSKQTERFIRAAGRHHIT